MLQHYHVSCLACGSRLQDQIEPTNANMHCGSMWPIPVSPKIIQNPNPRVSPTLRKNHRSPRKTAGGLVSAGTVAFALQRRARGCPDLRVRGLDFGAAHDGPHRSGFGRRGSGHWEAGRSRRIERVRERGLVEVSTSEPCYY